MDMKSYTDWNQHSADQSSIKKVTWNKKDLETLPWEPTYMTDEIPVNDSWDTFATKNKKKLEKMYAEWGVSKQSTLHYMSIRPELTDGLKDILSPYKTVKHNYNFLKLTPGCSLMWHFDTYATFVKYNGISEQNVKNVCRTVVMMDEWDRGQVLQVGGSTYTNWNAGDTYTWKGDVWHGMANFGPSDIIISQITFLDENDKYTQ
tara:strand:- start:716 stop:1327 length:612 start_codon:yes stop_codon:yes gene_type:complete